MEAEFCERISVCCGAQEHEAEGFCGQCCDATGFECSVHEIEWPNASTTCSATSDVKYPKVIVDDL